ncbi:MAG TPA: type II toxin-antitoxin system VapC family toxin [Blastocatellia bacterium]|nr:type II toxin-antitoxin system VapC family toxin [Blastocatellia bacterium]
MADAYYADSSVLVKRHVQEVGTSWFRSVSDPATGNALITSRLSVVEVYSAFNRRRREAKLSQADYTQLADDFAAICAAEYQIIELTVKVTERARLLLEKYPLRAGDAIQLASALVASDTLQIAGLPAPIFLAADDRLLNAARAEGLATDDPRAHP